MQRFLNGRGAKQDILNFDPSCIKSATLKRLENFLVNHKNSFDPAVVKRASSAALPLAVWVQACVSFAQVYNTVRPLQDELNSVETLLKTHHDELDKCKHELDEIEQTMTRLKQDFTVKSRDTLTRKEELDILQKSLLRAETLVDLLKGMVHVYLLYRIIGRYKSQLRTSSLRRDD